MSRKCQWFAVGAGLLTRPPSVDRDARRARRLGAPPYRVSPCGASFFPSDGKETKGSPGETHIAVGAGLGPARPRFMGTAPSGAPPTRTLCHGWSEPGAVVKWCRPKFCAGPGPSGPEGINTWNRILRAGTSAEGYRDNPRKRGSGGGATMGGDAHRSPPPVAFCLLCRRGQRRSPRRAKPCKVRRAESSRPTDVMVHEGRACLGPVPTAIHDHFRDMAGGASPSPTGWQEKRSSAADGRPLSAAPTAISGPFIACGDTESVSWLRRPSYRP